MKYNKNLLYFFLLIVVTTLKCSTPEPQIIQIIDNETIDISEKLNHPFGTILNLKVEVIDGDEFNMKALMGEYLFRIKNVNGKEIADTLIMQFVDETNSFPTDDLELSHKMFEKKSSELSSEENKQMKNSYVGKNFWIVAYETGRFTGIPEGYFDYRPIKADQPFHFKNYLVVISDLSKEEK